jgi:hypothetical protein
MKFTALVATTAAIAYAQEDPFSREGADLAMVVLVQGPALTSPPVDLGLASHEEENFKFPNRITPLGQRQQFLIGSELRRRYVYEAEFMSADYIISQAYLQAPFVSKNILAMQALMMGLYPATTANDLTEWQQSNAVPPMEGADFSEWQKELGAHALPYGLQTFPIQQAGLEADFLLSLSDNNCPYYTSKMQSTVEQIVKQSVDQISSVSSAWKQMVDTTSVGDVCAYLDWAVNNSVSIKKLEGTDQVLTICRDTYTKQMSRVAVEFDAAESHLVSSEFITKLETLIDVSQSTTRAEGLHPHELPLGFNNF